MIPPIRSWLYAPGNNAKLLERAPQSEADAVIFDLEDSVPRGEKERARAMVAEAVAARAGSGGPLVFVRVNHPETGLTEAEVRAVVRPGLAGIRVPKMESARSVRLVADWVSDAEAAAGLPAGSVKLVLGIESAVGVWRAAEIAEADSRVLALAFGAVDFAADIDARPESPDGRELLYAKSRLVLASRVAGVRAPVDSVYPRLDDEAGLERDTRAGRALGFFGKSAIHPRQLPIINRVYTPSDAELEAAHAIVEAAEQAEDHGIGALRLPSGEFVDLPVVERARALLALAARLGAADRT
ncbi:MAG: CoA ester lyase [Chloroflexota bacterium]|nr:CoA ester lyase [Dehalococcoidia bacterium]MDW8253918.1 CoA ester lyase [Chloroflexota bacterium]